MRPEECPSWNAPGDPDRVKLGDTGRLADARLAFADDLPHEMLLALFKAQQEDLVAASAKSAAGATKVAGKPRKIIRSPVRVMFNDIGAKLRRRLPARGYPSSDSNIVRALLRELLENFDQGRSEMLPDGFVRDIPEIDRDLFANPTFRIGDEAGMVVTLAPPYGKTTLSTLFRHTLEKK